MAERLIRGDRVALVLGDNLFYGNDLTAALRGAAARDHGATIFAYPVRHPERYGVVELDGAGRRVDLIEKPSRPRSNSR